VKRGGPVGRQKPMIAQNQQLATSERSPDEAYVTACYQVAVLKRKRSRPKLNSLDRLLWTALRHCWSCWTEVLVIVKPDTVIGWHRAGFRLYWRWRSRPRGGQRPILQTDRMCGVSSSGRDRVRRPSGAIGRHTAGRGGGARTRACDEVQPGFVAGTAASGSDRRGHQHPEQSSGRPMGFRVHA
jgi:hypothetical protein